MRTIQESRLEVIFKEEDLKFHGMKVGEPMGQFGTLVFGGQIYVYDLLVRKGEREYHIKFGYQHQYPDLEKLRNNGAL